MPRHIKKSVGEIHQQPTHTSKRQTWMTPRWILDLVSKMGPIVLDPCASDEPEFHFAKINFDKAIDGLVQSWQQDLKGLVFANHEYGRSIPDWVEKCRVEAENGVEIIQLCPARPGSNWYRAAKRNASATVEIHGRVKFDEHFCKDPAPFPSAMFYYGNRPYLFCHIFDTYGEVRILPSHYDNLHR